MRRALTFLTALSAATALAACSGDDEGSTEETSAEQSSEETSSEDAAGESEDGATSEDAAAGDAAQTSDGAAGTAVAGISDDPTCQAFFAGQGTPLAERAQAQRDVIEPGDDLDAVSFSEMTLLSGRVVALADEAQGEQAALLERINAPFQEVTDAVIEDGTRTEDTIAIPTVEVEDSAAAQDELEAACQS